MENSTEPLSPNPSSSENFSDKLKKIEAEGWVLVGQEKLTETKFDQEAKFSEVPFQTEDQIKEKYLQRLKNQIPLSNFEILLILNENTEQLARLRQVVSIEEYQKLLKNLKDTKKTYLVYARKI